MSGEMGRKFAGVYVFSSKLHMENDLCEHKFSFYYTPIFHKCQYISRDFHFSFQKIVILQKIWGSYGHTLL